MCIQTHFVVVVTNTDIVNRVRSNYGAARQTIPFKQLGGCSTKSLGAAVITRSYHGRV